MVKNLVYYIIIMQHLTVINYVRQIGMLQAIRTGQYLQAI